MIIGSHFLIYSKDAERDRAFFRDVLGFSSIDTGDGWLIFALPPAEMGVHPMEPDSKEHPELYLLCDNIERTIADLRSKGVTCSAIQNQRWGSLTDITLPGGGTLGMYQPRHPMAIETR